MDDFVIGIILFAVVLGPLSGCMYNLRERNATERELTKLQEKYNTDVTEIKGRYNGLSCKMRGYVVEEVEGIKLCMEPVTRSLHKIDDVNGK